MGVDVVGELKCGCRRFETRSRVGWTVCKVLGWTLCRSSTPTTPNLCLRPICRRIDLQGQSTPNQQRHHASQLVLRSADDDDTPSSSFAHSTIWAGEIQTASICKASDGRQRYQPRTYKVQLLVVLQTTPSPSPYAPPQSSCLLPRVPRVPRDSWIGSPKTALSPSQRYLDWDSCDPGPGTELPVEVGTILPPRIYAYLYDVDSSSAPALASTSAGFALTGLTYPVVLH